ncbi:MAG: hypothetical protein D6722_28965, partial [Bacteroidetes bacterium]
NNTIGVQEEPFDFSLGTNASISAMAISSLDPAQRYVLTDNARFFYSTDGGGSWQSSGTAALPGSHYFYGNAIWPSPVTPGKVYIAGSGYSNAPVFVSTNHGQSFTALDQGLPGTLVYDLCGTPEDDMLFAATEVGPYVYLASTGQWYPMDGLHAPDQIYWSVEYVDSLRAVRFGTYGRGIWDFFICDDQAPEPVAGFDMLIDSSTYSLSLTNTSSGAWTYEWLISDGTTSNQASLNHSLPGPGVYIVRLTASTPCASDVTLEQVILLPDTNTTNLTSLADQTLRVYPNPGSGPLAIELGETTGAVHLRLRNPQGRLVASHHARGGQTIRWDPGPLPAGLYLLEVWQAGRRLHATKLLRQP